jgi:hypothetical protein
MKSRSQGFEATCSKVSLPNSLSFLGLGTGFPPEDLFLLCKVSFGDLGGDPPTGGSAGLTVGNATCFISTRSAVGGESRGALGWSSWALRSDWSISVCGGWSADTCLLPSMLQMVAKNVIY